METNLENWDCYRLFSRQVSGDVRTPMNDGALGELFSSKQDLSVVNGCWFLTLSGQWTVDPDSL